MRMHAAGAHTKAGVSANAAVVRARVMKCATYARILRGAHPCRYVADFTGSFQALDRRKLETSP